jgi:hypothetical protein
MVKIALIREDFLTTKSAKSTKIKRGEITQVPDFVKYPPFVLFEFFVVKSITLR